MGVFAGVVAFRRPASAAVGRVELRATELVALADDGRIAWRHSFGGRRLHTGLVGVETRPTPRYGIADVDGDGASEVVASVPLDDGGNTHHDELYCFSATGGVLWKVVFEDDVAFAAGRFAPPWIDGHVVVSRIGGEPRVLWSQNHHTWWPGMVLVLDGHGRRLSTFMHAGHVRSLAVANRAGQPLVLVGGISNAYRAASLAVLEGSSIGGHGPVPAGSPYECLSCTPELPSRYFLFSSTDLNAASGLPYNYVRHVAPTPGGYDVYTLETASGVWPPPVGELVYHFSPSFSLTEAAASDSWIPAHQHLEPGGRIGHRRQRLPGVASWTAGRPRLELARWLDRAEAGARRSRAARQLDRRAAATRVSAAADVALVRPADPSRSRK